MLQIEARRKPFGHCNLIHHECGLKADIYPDAGDKLHQWAFQNRRRVELGEGLALWLAPPEYVIIRKLEYLRQGGSEKHLEDIRKMLPQVGPGLDRDFLEHEFGARGLTQYWRRVDDTPLAEKASGFDEKAMKARGMAFQGWQWVAQ